MFMLATFMLYCCIDVIDVRVSGEGLLVVDGLVTDADEAYVVRLARSSSFDNSNVIRGFNIPEIGATVAVIDDQGGYFNFTEAEAGSYKCVNFRGQVGMSYQLFITLKDGRTYQSTWEEIPVPVSIERIEASFRVIETLFTNAAGNVRVNRVEGFDVFVTVTDPGSSNNYYRWKLSGIFEFFSITDSPDVNRCWVPLERLESGLMIADDSRIQGKMFRELIGRMPYERPTRFLATVRQENVSEKAFSFWRKLQDQQVNTGSLFDPTPTPVRGNIVGQDPSEVVLGYFATASVSTARLLVDRFKASGFVNPANAVMPKFGDCRTHEQNATNVKPDGF